jgi:hypothetical protein
MGLGPVEVFFILVVVALVVYVLWRLLSVHAARLHSVGAVRACNVLTCAGDPVRLGVVVVATL